MDNSEMKEGRRCQGWEKVTWASKLSTQVAIDEGRAIYLNVYIATIQLSY